MFELREGLIQRELLLIDKSDTSSTGFSIVNKENHKTFGCNEKLWNNKIVDKNKLKSIKSSKLNSNILILSNKANLLATKLIKSYLKKCYHCYYIKATKLNELMKRYKKFEVQDFLDELCQLNFLIIAGVDLITNKDLAAIKDKFDDMILILTANCSIKECKYLGIDVDEYEVFNYYLGDNNTTNNQIWTEHSNEMVIRLIEGANLKQADKNYIIEALKIFEINYLEMTGTRAVILKEHGYATKEIYDNKVSLKKWEVVCKKIIKRNGKKTTIPYIVRNFNEFNY